MGVPITGMDRRRTLRAPVHGRAVVRGEGATVHGTIDNLSLGGVRIALRAPVAADDALALELHLPRRTLAVRGRGVRVDRDATGAHLAARFEALGGDAEDAVADAVEHAYAASRRRAVLVVDAPERQGAIAQALRARRMCPLVPRTPLEAIDLLARVDEQVGVCLLGPRFADACGDELELAIVEAFPWVRVLRMGPDAVAIVEDAASTWDQLERSWQARVA